MLLVGLLTFNIFAGHVVMSWSTSFHTKRASFGKICCHRRSAVISQRQAVAVRSPHSASCFVLNFCRIASLPASHVVLASDIDVHSCSNVRSAHAGVSESDMHGATAWLPGWFPAAYDLATEVQFFLEDYQQASYFENDLCCCVCYCH